jgi:hypothetical protein
MIGARDLDGDRLLAAKTRLNELMVQRNEGWHVLAELRDECSRARAAVLREAALALIERRAANTEVLEVSVKSTRRQFEDALHQADVVYEAIRIQVAVVKDLGGSL